MAYRKITRWVDQSIQCCESCEKPIENLLFYITVRINNAEFAFCTIECKSRFFAKYNTPELALEQLRATQYEQIG